MEGERHLIGVGGRVGGRSPPWGRAPTERRGAIPSWAITCREVLRELSNYMESDLGPELRSQIDSHLAECRHCTAVYEGTRNLLTLVAGGKAFELPEGFSRRLRTALEEKRAAENRNEPGG